MPRVVIHQDQTHSDYSVDSQEHISRSSYPSYRTGITSERPSVSRQNTHDSANSRQLVRYYEDYHSASEDSVDTSTSSLPSDGATFDHAPEYEQPQWVLEYYQSEAIPASSTDFAELFPSSRTISIQHDDSTLDGNMNLRLDTNVTTQSGRAQKITLFHLRMYDLKGREFSLRRYCRDSGREICHSRRKQQKHLPAKRPILSRSWSNAFAALKAHTSTNSSIIQKAPLTRQDSGYESDEGDYEDDYEPPEAPTRPQSSNDSISLEFSNYAHVDIKRCGLKAGKRYEFIYWGSSYAWRRVVRRSKGTEVVSFHLLRQHDGHAAAHIVPQTLTSTQACEEQGKGGWIPPCSLWITDPAIADGHSDVGDVVVATGLMALIDDSIRRRFHSKRARQLIVPTLETSSGMTNVDFIGPKRLIDEAFGRAPLTSTRWVTTPHTSSA